MNILRTSLFHGRCRPVTVTATSGLINGTLVVQATPQLNATITMGRDAYGVLDAMSQGVRGRVHVAYLDGGLPEHGWVRVFIQRQASVSLPGQVTTLEGDIGPDGAFEFEVPDDWERAGEYTVRAFPSTYLHHGRAEAHYRVAPVSSGPI